MLKFSGCPCLISGRCSKGDSCGSFKPTTKAQRQARPSPTGESHAYRLAPSHSREAASGAVLSADRLIQPDGHFRPNHNYVSKGEGSIGMSDAEADMLSTRRPRAQFAFKNSMVHGNLQFTLLIALRCVLHRYGSQDIRC